ncbi:MAG: aldo/keto reductase [Phycisphaeraceae bacterium]
MKTRELGRTGIQVSEIGLGGWGLGGVYYGEVTREQGIEAVRAYLDAGGNHLDTAYAYHTSEEIIGEAIQGYDREKLVIASKTYAGTWDTAEIPKVREHLEISLRDLGTDYVDLYDLHGSPEDPDKMHRLLDFFLKLKEEGKVRAIGCSIRGPNVDDASLANAKQYAASGKLDAMQLAFSVLRQKHREVFKTAAENGVGIIARAVLESGMITGKYKPGHEFTWPDQRTRYGKEKDVIFEEAQKLQAYLPEGYDSTAQLATKYVLAHPEVCSVILGGVNADQFRRNAAMDELPDLPDEIVQQLTERYQDRNDEFNPTLELEHVPSPRRPLEGDEPKE